MASSEREPSSGRLKGIQALRAKRHGALGHGLCREGSELLTRGRATGNQYVLARAQRVNDVLKLSVDA